MVGNGIDLIAKGKVGQGGASVQPGNGFRRVFAAQGPGGKSAHAKAGGGPGPFFLGGDGVRERLGSGTVGADELRMVLAQLEGNLAEPYAKGRLDALAGNWMALNHIRDSPHGLRRQVQNLLREAQEEAGSAPDGLGGQVEESRRALARILRKAPVEYGC